MKFIDLEKQYELLKDEIDSNIHDVLNHGQYIMGPEILTLEENLSKFVGVKNTVSCASGTDALLMALMALDVKRDDYVITTPFTYIATAEAISLLGAIPKFIDIDSKTFNIDMQKLEYELNQNPGKYRFVMPVNIFGAPVDYDYLYKLKEKHNFTIIEDAAQSLGASFKGQISGGLGDVGCTSFYPAKPLGCYGDGGAVFINDDGLADKLRSIREHGAGEDKYNNVRLGINGRMDTIQAAILLPKLKVFQSELEKRNLVAMKYKDKLDREFQTQLVLDGCLSSWAQFSILCDSSEHREKILQKLKDNKIPTAIYYITPLHLQDVFNDLGYHSKSFSVTENVCSKILSLPMNPYLSDNEIDKISEVILGV